MGLNFGKPDTCKIPTDESHQPMRLTGARFLACVLACLKLPVNSYLDGDEAVVTTLAGNATRDGGTDGVGAQALFKYPSDVDFWRRSARRRLVEQSDTASKYHGR